MVCYPVDETQVLRCASSQSEKPYQMSEWFLISVLSPRRNWEEKILTVAEEEEEEKKKKQEEEEKGHIYRKKARRTTHWMKEWMKENLCCHYFTAPRKNLHRSSAQNPISLQLCCLRSRNAAFGILSTIGARRSGIPFLRGKKRFFYSRKGTYLLVPTG